jgi:hypothetical protein
MLASNLFQQMSIDTTRYKYNVAQFVCNVTFHNIFSMVVTNVIAMEEWPLQLRLVQL